MQKDRKPRSHQGILYCACTAAVLGGIWLLSGLLKKQPLFTEVWLIAAPRLFLFCSTILAVGCEMGFVLYLVG